MRVSKKPVRIFSEDRETGREGEWVPARVITLLILLCLLFMPGRVMGYEPVPGVHPAVCRDG